MQKSKMALAALMLIVTAMLAVGCTKPDEPGNGGNGGNIGGGNGGETPVSFIVSVSANPTDGGSVAGGGTFQENETCTVSATPNTNYTFANWTENDSVVSTEVSYAFIATANRSLVANFTYLPAGAINGKFTINANGDQVYFSQGNLQYIGSAATPYWKFAENQWDILGTTSGQNSTSSNIDRDLFGWGTSGWNSGANCYQPWSTSTSNSDYYPGGSYVHNLTGSYANADWGVYNAMSNGGNQAGQWRTLTGGSNGEWYYVFNTRNTSSGIRYAKAQVAGVNGVILLPDDWSTSTYSLSNTNSNGASFSSNVITASQWTTLENAGAVFLPAAGGRDGASVLSVGSGGGYWSSSYGSSDGAYGVLFSDLYLYTGDWSGRLFGHSVRLVCPAE